MNADFDVRYTAGLARLNLSDAEAELFQSQLSKVLEYVDKLKQVDVTGVEPTAYANPVVNVVREDEPGASLPLAEALANAPRQANNLVIVAKVIE